MNEAAVEDLIGAMLAAREATSRFGPDRMFSMLDENTLRECRDRRRIVKKAGELGLTNDGEIVAMLERGGAR